MATRSSTKMKQNFFSILILTTSSFAGRLPEEVYKNSEEYENLQLDRNQANSFLENDNNRNLDLESHDDRRSWDMKNEQLSDQDFGTNEYDHDAILGEENSITFESLPREEAQARWNMVFEKIDKNRDENLSPNELTTWIRYVTSKWITKEIEEQFPDVDRNNDGRLTWEEVEKSHYPEFFDGDDDDKDQNQREHQEAIRKMSLESGQDKSWKRDERRFRYADVNDDNYLDENEYAMFLHPEEYSNMRDVLVEEILDEIDDDKDRRISENEYLKDMWNDQTLEEVLNNPANALRKERGDGPFESDDNEDDENVLHAPNWIETEAQTFRDVYDKNRDGYLDKPEILDWILGGATDNVEVEVNHLMMAADDDQNGLINRHEAVVEHMDIFVGSAALDFGDVIVRHTEF